MNWYIAKLVYRIICGEGEHTPQFDEQIRLFAAAGFEEAFAKARAAGKAESVSFHNQNEQLVQWRFIDVADLYQLHRVVDGAELYSRIEERDNGDDYENFVCQKARQLSAQTAPLHLI